MTQQDTPDPTNPMDEEYTVEPTGREKQVDEKTQYHHTDIAITALFGHHVANINSVRQAIWQRYAAMLVANSFFLGFVNAPGRSVI